jgi:hypothetical protein
MPPALGAEPGSVVERTPTDHTAGLSGTGGDAAARAISALSSRARAFSASLEPGCPARTTSPRPFAARSGRSGVPRRRAVADGVVSELVDAGHQDAAQCAEAQRWRAREMCDTGLEPVPPRLVDLRQPLGPGDPAHAVADRALSEAWKLAAAAKPPPGSVHARRSCPSGRVIRATGSDWTLVARTGTPSMLVLIADDAPRRLLDVSGADQASAQPAQRAASDRLHCGEGLSLGARGHSLAVWN